MKRVISRIFFVVFRLPFIFFKQPQWLKRFFLIFFHDGLYRSLQYAYDNFGNENYVQQEKIYQDYCKRHKNDKCNFPVNQPLISIVVPVYNTHLPYLKKMFDSVLSQSYKNWELCIADGSTKKITSELVKKYEKKDTRIKSVAVQNAGISGNTNVCLKFAHGEYIALLDADDELTKDALADVCFGFEQSNADLVYTDHATVARYGVKDKIFFKPDWSPDYLLSTNYICHFVVFKKTLLEKTGLYESLLDGAQDYDMLLKISEVTEKIHHIPKVLYYWRQAKTSSSYDITNHANAIEAGRLALQNACFRRGINAEVADGFRPGFYRIRRKIVNSPLVSIIIPFSDNLSLLKLCLCAIKKSTYSNYEIILVNNNSKENVEDFFATAKREHDRIFLLHYSKPFNFSAINNFAAQYAEGQYLIFLNNDTEIIAKDWIEAMLEQALFENTGAVGAKLLFPNKTLQHCGVVIDRNFSSRHIFMHLADNEKRDFNGRINCINNYSAVTGAAMMLQKIKFEEVNGFDENLPVNYNDVDLCLRLKKKGYFTVYTPYALLQHYGSATRIMNPEGSEDLVKAQKYMKQKWNKSFYYDPFFPYI